MATTVPSTNVSGGDGGPPTNIDNSRAEAEETKKE
ncbi:hypothetical protein BVRB_9g225930 [Beta vulgaris subsp. vulgaris]|uniref:Uncharacterized protein n=1 Tax=Beta vulgaris subsp. vulgaris TaxID=3555 RepID=A0A0J8B5S4_BETVV|nr:hypothetical protein BVRB_9g225930 [Beta vulgaris subsp. vulgaris]